MNVARFAVLLCLLVVAHPVLAGTGRQQTTFLLAADERTVCRWIEQNASAIDESTGAEVLAVQGRQSKLHKETKEGPFTFIVEHDPERNGLIRTVLLKSDKENLVSQETEIQVQREGEATRVTIKVTAVVNGHTGMAISIGIRPSLRGMRKLLETQFGTPTGN